MTHHPKSTILVGRVFSGASIKTLWLFLLAALALAIAPLPVLADGSAPQEQPKAKLTVDLADSSGAYTKSLAIAVPPFHGIEPTLVLGYSSSGENGFVGTGWGLGGLSLIERASPGGGAPRYDATDVYLLEGEELVPNCTTFGGTHCPKHQTYQRISFNPAANSGAGQWTIWDKDGTKSTYNSPVTTGVIRWLLATETDVYGNTVTYNYWCESGANCYPDTITYNNATITFYRESRPSTDKISYATGTAVNTSNYRLRSIGVKVGTNHARAYVLSYYESGTTKRSLLQTVQTYGSDVMLNGSGVPTSGTSFPATTLGYTGSAATSNVTISTAQNNPWANLSACISGDYNQDGNSTDIACYMGGANNNEWHLWLSSPTGWVWGGYRYLVSGTSTTDVSSRCLGGDFNRDGMSDVACYTGADGTWNVALTTGNVDPNIPMTWTVQSWTNGPGTAVWNGSTWVVSPVSERCFAGDYNGDGRTDIACNKEDVWRVGLSTGSAWTASTWTGPTVSPTIPITNRCLTGDFNGDGKTDISCQTGTQTGSWSTYLANATGTNFSNAGNWTAGSVPLPVGEWCLAGDYNGDGKTDLACYTGSNGSWHTALSTGSSYAATYWASGVAPASGMVGTRCVASDINGDGRTDITCITNTSTGIWTTSRSVGDNWQPVMNWNGIGGVSTLRAFCVPGDNNGDGLADFACRGTDWKAYYPLGELGHPDLLKTVENGIGGKTTVTYAPSSRWANYNTSWSWLPLHDVPVGMVLPTVKELKAENGTTTLETTAYRYEYAKWSHNLKRFVGFARADTHGADGACHVSRHSQTDASAGALTEYAIYPSVISTVPTYKTTRSYIETSAPPYTSLVDEEQQYEHSGLTTARVSKKKNLYDAYGNVVQLYDYGDTDLTTDDTTLYTWYYPNTTNYVVNKPAFVNVYAGIGTTGALIAQTLNHYDNNTYYYDTPTLGKLTKVSKWDNQLGAPSADTSVAYNNTIYGYDSYGNVTSTTDPEGRVTTVTYNDPLNTTYNNVYPFKTCRDPSGLNQCVNTKWDLQLGLPTEVTDPNNAVAKTSYDPLGRKISETDAANNVTTWSYQNIGNPTSQRVREIHPDGSPADSWSGLPGHWTDTYMDGFGRPYFVEKEAGEGYFWDEGLQEYVLYITTYAQKIIYKNGSSQPWKQSNWYYGGGTPVYTEFEYDGMERVTKVTHPDGSTITHFYEFDGANKPYVRTVREMGQETKTWYDTAGRTIKVEEKNGSETYTTTFEYDPIGRHVKTTDTLSNQTNTTYDSLGRKLTESRAGGATWTYTYYKDGQLKTEKDAKNQTNTVTYDAVGRLKTQVISGQTTTWYYDEAGYGSSIGRLTRVVFPGGSKENTYNSRGLVTVSKTCIDNTTNCRSVTTAYDGINRPTTVTYPDSEVVTNAYSTDGNLVSVSGYVSNMYWNPAGQLLSMSYVNGTTNTYTYDANREWLKTAIAKMGTTTRYTATYDYDVSGRVTVMTQGTPTAVTTKYAYDPLDRLLTVRDGSDVLIQSYSYNGIGNITHNSQIGSYTYGDAGHKHAVTASGASNTYSYDANGSMLTSPGTTYTWDTRNRLASVTRNSVTTTFGYDEVEQRVKKTTGSVVTYYFSPQAERWDSTDIQYYYAGSILVAQKDGTTKNWYHGDRLGSTRLMTNASGAESKEYDYKAFGADTAGGTARNERGYTSHITDGETGLVYMGARYYAATLSRFISADSMIGRPYMPQELNRYTYVNNNPINDVDPDGHCGALFGACVGAIVGGVASGVAAAARGESVLDVFIATGEGALAGFGGGLGLKGVKKALRSESFNKLVRKLGGKTLSDDKIARIAGVAGVPISGASLAGVTAGTNQLRKEDKDLTDALIAGMATSSARLYGVIKKRGKAGSYKELWEDFAEKISKEMGYREMKSKLFSLTWEAISPAAKRAFAFGVAARGTLGLNNGKKINETANVEIRRIRGELQRTYNRLTQVRNCGCATDRWIRLLERRRDRLQGELNAWYTISGRPQH